MRIIEKLLIGTVLGALPIIVCTIAGWWISIPFVPESKIVLFALSGFILGVLCDVIFLKGRVRRAYTMKNSTWIGVYIFYSIGLFGMFMGVPVFNVFLAVPAGLLIGRRLSLKTSDPSRVNQAAKRTALFTSIVLGLICICSGFIALLNSSTADDLQGILGLASPVSQRMIVFIILAGGAFLIVLNSWLTVKSVKFSYRFLKKA